MAISPVNLTDTFDVWRTRTNQLITLSDATTSNVSNVSNIATSAFTGANTANTRAVAAFTQANTVNVQSIASFAQANTANIQSIAAFAQANTANIRAVAAFTQANTVNTQSIAAFARANTADTQSIAAFGQANTANIRAVAAFTQANTVNTQSISAFAQANTANIRAVAAFTQANTVNTQSIAAFARANSALPNTSGVSFAGNLTFPSGNVTMNNNEVVAAKIRDFSLTRNGPSISSGTITIDYAAGNVVEINLNQNITNWTINNWPTSGELGKLTIILTQDATGGKTVAFPGSWRWPYGVVPTVTSTANKTDIIILLTSNAGTTVYAATGGQSY